MIPLIFLFLLNYDYHCTPLVHKFVSHENYKSTALHRLDMSSTTWFVSFAGHQIYLHTTILIFLTFSFAITTHTCNVHMFMPCLSLTYCTHIAVPNVLPWNGTPIFTP